MCKPLLLPLLAVAALGVAPLGAQVTVRATAATQLRVHAQAATTDTRQIAAGTDITAGASLIASVTDPVPGSASLNFALTHGSDRSKINFDERGSAWPHLIFTASAANGPHSIEVAYATTRPTRVEVTARYCTSWSNTNGRYDGTLTVGTTVIHPTTNDTACLFGYSHTRTFDAMIDQNGLTVRFDTAGWCVGDWGPGGIGNFQGRWEVELVPDPDFPCTTTSYGAGCGGATLAASTDFDRPGTHLLTVTDPGPMAIALIAFGDQRASIPLPPNCTVLNNLVFAVPASLSGGAARLRVTPPAIPGLVFQVQGAVGLTDFTLHLSNGIELVCP